MDPWDYYCMAVKADFVSLPGKRQREEVEIFANGGDLPSTNTFRYIVDYLDGKKDSPRLPIAAADYCVRLEDLHQALSKNVSARDFARTALAVIAKKETPDGIGEEL